MLVRRGCGDKIDVPRILAGRLVFFHPVAWQKRATFTGKPVNRVFSVVEAGAPRGGCLHVSD